MPSDAEIIAGLKIGLVSYWKFTEPTGAQRLDSWGSNHLTDHNTVVTGLGPGVLNAAEFIAASSQYLDIAHNPTLSFGDADMSISGWAKSAATASDRIFVQKGTAAGNLLEYMAHFVATTNLPVWSIISPAMVAGIAIEAAVNSAWHYFDFAYDAAANKLRISVDGDEIDTVAALSGGAIASLLPLQFGRYSNAGAPTYFQGSLAAWMLHGRQKTNVERAYLYNAGSGRYVDFSQAATASPTPLTVSDYIAEALQDLGVIASGETPNADDAAFALTRFRRFVDQLKIRRLFSNRILRSTWTIASGDGQYSVGIGGDINIQRPQFVDHVNYLNSVSSPAIEYPLIPLTDDAYAALRLKTQESALPIYWYYDRTVANANLILWPTPTSATLTGVLYSPQSVSDIVALSDVLTLPPGYHDFFVSNLALALAPGFQREPPPSLVALARESKADVEASNFPMMDLSIDRAAQGQYTRYRIETDS